MYVLGIETSCDETAAAVIHLNPQTGEKAILANLVLSQLNEHRAFGGVVPEIAARAHMDHLHTLIQGAMDDSGLSWRDLDGIAATCGPGLIGGVMVGMMAGKTIAAALDRPFIAVNHLEAHALTARLSHDVAFPYLVLLVSGGHTQILLAEDVGVYRQWGTTLDDALGECFDKVARLMGLGHPGGPMIERMAATCTDITRAKARFDLPIPMKGRKTPDFSFSGLKTAMRLHIESLPAGDLSPHDVADLCACFQDCACAAVVDRCAVALARFLGEYGAMIPSPTLVVCGGVAANLTIRQGLETLCSRHNVRFVAPPLGLCADNAAMIAWTGIERMKKGLYDSLDVAARPRWPLDPATQK